MARPRRVDMELMTQAQVVAAQASDVDSLRCAQAVLGVTLEQAAMLLGVGRASVVRLQARLRQLCANPDAVRPSWGGRRRACLTPQQESDFLARWQDDTNAGGVLVAWPLRAALAQRLGRPVAASVVYRMLARHGWRKVAPDTRHPKSDPQVQQEWKKTPRNTGSAHEARRCQGSQGAPDVPGRGAVWSHGADSPLLGAQPRTSDGAQRLRTGIRIRVWRRQPH